MKIFFFQFLSSASLAGAFAPSYYAASVFGRSSHLYAEGGAPKYDKRDAILRQAEVVGDGSVMLHIDISDDTTIDYQPGHVLALEIEDIGLITTNEKNAEDSKNNGAWMRGPYTVSRASKTSFDVLLKVVGDKSRRFASAEPGTALKFGGKFKVPIYEGISKEDTKRVVLISTGTGVGPCIGAIEQMLEDDEFSAKVDLFASYRTEPEVLYSDYLDSLVTKHPDQFQWKVVVTSETGRISHSEENVRMITATDGICDVKDTHYHLIGNGQLVNEWKAGLAQAGVPEQKVTVESYFNHKAPSSEKAIETIANAISAAALNPVA
jgi:ferredoxin-NADP reductase